MNALTSRKLKKLRNSRYAKLAVIGMVTSAALLATQAARAEDGNWKSSSWYAGINAGGSHVSDFSNGISKRDDNDTTYSVNVGYQFNRYFAVEANYTDFGKFKVSNAVGTGDWKSDGVGVSAVGILPMDNRLALYGKAGAFYSDTRVDNLGVSNDKRTNGTVGVGASYDFGNRIIGKAEWNYYQDVGGSSTGKPTVNTYTLGVAYRF
ncbi:MAG TPA: outer membrane beta-barrel protein [Rhodocyclaceae bacterium]|nr:outer membrane beta-barrel protein [Rhodocyclaceae bacterium]